MILLNKHAYEVPRLDCSMIARGNKIFQLKLKFGNRSNPKGKRLTPTSFHDSINIIPIRLGKFVKTLDLRENGKPLEDKGIFSFI